METSLKSINDVREATISKHFDAAFAELKAKAEADPLQVTFIIYAGCVSSNVTAEIVHRLNAGDIKAVAGKSGVISVQHYITAEVALPSSLVHEEKKEVKVVVVPEQVTVSVEITEQV